MAAAAATATATVETTGVGVVGVGGAAVEVDVVDADGVGKDRQSGRRADALPRAAVDGVGRVEVEEVVVEGLDHLLRCHRSIRLQ